MSDSMRDRIARELGKDRLHELDKPVFGGRQLSDKQIEGIAVALLEAFPWLADEPTEQEVEARARAEGERRMHEQREQTRYIEGVLAGAEWQAERDAERLADLAAEVERLNDALDAAQVRHCMATDRGARLQAKLDDVRALHTPRTVRVLTGDCAAEECDHEEVWEHPLTDFQQCVECDRIADAANTYYDEDGVSITAWPCPTIQTLDEGNET